MANIMKIFMMIGVITMLAFSVSAAPRLEKATFAGGYKDYPAYEEASSGKTGVWEDKKVSQEAVPQVAGGKWRTFVKPSRDELKKRLTAMQYKVTQENGTEPAYRNEYAENKREGIYVDIVSGEPLYSSLDKYDSGTGWPSFTRPLEPGNIVEKEDRNLFFMKRTEVRSKHGDSHLGHVFNDGPKPTGLRYCMNSAALRFIAKEDLVKEGYGEYLTLFKRQAGAK